MGVGKSTIGKALARHLAMDFVDSDHEIEDRTGATISLIFDIEGEDGFRAREVSMIGELVQRNNIVLATGGGSVMTEDNRRALRKNGVVIYLSASVATQVKRVRNNRNRPLLEGGDPEKFCANSGKSEIRYIERRRTMSSRPTIVHQQALRAISRKNFRAHEQDHRRSRRAQLSDIDRRKPAR